MKRSILSGLSGVLSGTLGFVVALPGILLSHSAVAGEWPTDQNAYVLANKTYSGAATDTNTGSTGNSASSPVAAIPWYTLSSGVYLPAGSYVASSCPKGYFCSGGTYGYNASSAQGLTVCPANTFSTGGAGSECSPCGNTYKTSGTAASNHDEAADCKRTFTLNKNGGSGSLATGNSGTASLDVVCSRGVACNFPDPSGMINDAYEYSGWGTLSSCTDGVLSVTTPTQSPYYACKKPAVIALKMKNDGSSYGTTYYFKYGTDKLYSTAAYASDGGTTGQITTIPNMPTRALGKFLGFSDTGVNTLLIKPNGTLESGFSQNTSPNDNGTRQLIAVAQWQEVGAFPLASTITVYNANGQAIESGVEVTNPGTAQIYYSLNTGTGGTNQAFSDPHAGTVMTKITVPTASAKFHFGGYFTQQGGKGTQAVDAQGNILSAWLNSVTTIGTNVNLYALWNYSEITCAAGKYLNKSQATCVTCEAGYYCPGGTFDATSTNDKMLCAHNYYSNAGASSCTQCNSGYQTMEGASDDGSAYHDSASDCTTTITLNKNGGSGVLPGINGNVSGETSASMTCKQGEGCTFPNTSSGTYALTKKGYTFDAKWGTNSACTGTTYTGTATSPTGDVTYYACRSANPIYIKWSGVDSNPGTGFTAVSGQSNVYTSNTVYDGNIVTPRAAVVASAGQTFLGWKFQK